MDRRKELKRSYLEMEKPIGAYRIVNKVTGRMLVGVGINLDAVFNSYKFQLKYGGLINKELAEDWKKYGEENFSFEVLELIKQKDDPNYKYSDDLKILEEIWLDKLEPYEEKGYNKRTVKK